jgi:NADH-quinone oxidoreductase subunit H
MEFLGKVVDFVFGQYGSVHFAIVTGLIKILIFMLVLGPGIASILTWLERRQSAMMQDRVGPNRAYLLPPRKGETRGRWRMWGITHFMADALKFLFKEDFVPPKAHKLLFALGPILALAPALIVSAIIPFGPDLCWGRMTEVVAAGTCATPVRLQAASLDVGVLFYFAISSLSVYGATLAGWASYNKWSLMGGVRASSQMMSYEVTMGMAVLVMFLVYGTLEPGAMVEQQGSWPWQWGIFGGLNHSVLMGIPCIISFILFLTAAIAETKRTPFDIPEGEPEIIGYFVEYSGMRFGLFFLGEFIEIVFSSALMVAIFFGGWHSGVGVFDDLIMRAPNVLAALLGLGVFLGKTFTFCAFQLLIRWSLPRFRSDQLMQLGWQRLLPVSIANVLLAAGWLLLVK